jgi:D-alanine transaminase
VKDIAYVNGQFTPLSDATISISDRGLLFGDSVYEVLRCYQQSPFLFEYHIERLNDSLLGLGIKAESIVCSLREIITQGLFQSNYPETLVYIQITRGTQERHLIYGEEIKPNIIVTFRKLVDDEVKKLRESGISIWLHPDTRWDLCNLKTTNLLPNVLIKNKAYQHGFLESALFLPDRTVTECCSSSLFIVQDNNIITTPSSPYILDGVSRRYVIEKIAPQIGKTVLEKTFSIDELMTASEVFITSTGLHIMPVIKVAENKIHNGVPGPITKQLINKMLNNIHTLNSFSNHSHAA